MLVFLGKKFTVKTSKKIAAYAKYISLTKIFRTGPWNNFSFSPIFVTLHALRVRIYCTQYAHRHWTFRSNKMVSLHIYLLYIFCAPFGFCCYIFLIHFMLCIMQFMHLRPTKPNTIYMLTWSCSCESAPKMQCVLYFKAAALHTPAYAHT